MHNFFHNTMKKRLTERVTLEILAENGSKIKKEKKKEIN